MTIRQTPQLTHGLLPRNRCVNVLRKEPLGLGLGIEQAPDWSRDGLLFVDRQLGVLLQRFDPAQYVIHFQQTAQRRGRPQRLILKPSLNRWFQRLPAWEDSVMAHHARQCRTCRGANLAAHPGRPAIGISGYPQHPSYLSTNRTKHREC